MSNPIELQPGDLLLYRNKSWKSRLIQWRTASPWSHVEVYAGEGMSMASRDGEGVDLYPFRGDVGKVLRPNGAFDYAKGREWFETVRGQKYDWNAALWWVSMLQSSRDRFGKQNCSELATRLYRRMGLSPVASTRDADTVSPGMLADSPIFTEIAI